MATSELHASQLPGAAAFDRSATAPLDVRHKPKTPDRLAGLSVVLPCFNEEGNVVEAVRDAARAARKVSARYEVIVIDDGSTDATAREAAGCVAHDRSVRLVAHEHNLGYGAAVRSGIEAASMPFVLLTDADLQFDLLELEQFVPHVASYDLVVGRRMNRGDPFFRRANARSWNWLVRHLFDLPIRDVDCAFKLIRRDALTNIELVSTGAMISTELIARCLQSGARLTEVDVHHRPRIRGEQSGANPKVIARAFRELSQLRAALRPAAPAAS